jgi:hypothetical protein
MLTEPLCKVCDILTIQARDFMQRREVRASEETEDESLPKE